MWNPLLLFKICFLFSPFWFCFEMPKKEEEEELDFFSFFYRKLTTSSFQKERESGHVRPQTHGQHLSTYGQALLY